MASVVDVAEVLQSKILNSAVVDVQPSRIATSVDVNKAKAAAAPDWQLDKAVKSASRACYASS